MTEGAKLDWHELCPEVLHLIPDWRRSPDFKPWKPPLISWEQSTPARKAALRRAWKAGDLRYKLSPDQRLIYAEFRGWFAKPTKGQGKRGKKYALDMARRRGKSTLSLLLAVEERLRNPRRRRIAFWCDTTKMCKEIMLENFPLIFDDCPPELRPEWYPSRNRIVWNQDHRNLDMCPAIDFAGLDDPNRARGRSLYFGVVDEPAFLQNLHYIDKSVLRKQLIGVEGAALVYTSTPPETPSHYWSSKLVPECMTEGAYQHGTIFGGSMLSDEEVWDEILDSGGVKDSTTRRELFAEHTPEETMAVLPEAVEYIDSGKLILPEDAQLPVWRMAYTSMDPGWNDSTALLFGSIDFDRQKLIIEKEWLAAKAPSSKVAKAVQEIENRLWAEVYWYKDGQSHSNPHRRFTDAASAGGGKRLVADLRNDHELRFQISLKDNLQQQINRVRNWILDGTLVVHPRCKNLLRQMRNAVFQNESRSKFAQEGRLGHFDLVATLIYLCRNTEPYFRRNPRKPQSPNQDTQFIRPVPQENHVQQRQQRAQARKTYRVEKRRAARSR